jgi:hypothetical protein
MKWRKLGPIYRARGEQRWAQSHAYVPTAVRQETGCIRVYAAFLDSARVGRLGFVDVDADDPRRILRVSTEPSLDVGQPGAFDENGVTPASIVDHQGRRFLYYFGWQLGVNVRYHMFNGLAVSIDAGETFRRVSKVPITDRTDGEMVNRSAAHVLIDHGVWKMWYVAGDEWRLVNGSSLPTYEIKYLESPDGVSWGRRGEPAVRLCGPDEFGLGRPFVLHDRELWRMWYSVRTVSMGYRLGYAESEDGRRWERRDADVGIDVSPSGWDSEMVCFSSVVGVGDRLFMFYNGNRYGETGFGVAVADAF